MEHTNMWLFKWVAIAIAVWVGLSKIALADALDTWTTWSTNQPYVSKQVPPFALVMRGIGTDAYYPVEVDPATGAIPVDATVVFPPGTEVEVTNFPATVDVNYGTPGSSTIREAAMLGVGSTAVSVSNPVPVKDVGHTYADSVRNVYSSTNVTTGAWVQLIASTAAVINCITVFDSCGQTLELGTGAMSSETRKLIIPPGGISGCTPLAIPAATRVSIRAISATCSIGELDITGLN